MNLKKTSLGKLSHKFGKTEKTLQQIIINLEKLILVNQYSHKLGGTGKLLQEINIHGFEKTDKLVLEN